MTNLPSGGATPGGQQLESQAQCGERLRAAEAPQQQQQQQELPWLYSSSCSLSLSSDGIQGKRLSNGFTYIFCLIGCAVGAGSFEPFSVAAYKNGGVVFIPIYLIVVTFMVTPIIILEIALASLTEGGNLRAFAALGPRCHSVGFLGLGALSALFDYPMKVTFGATYLIHSFDDPLPWKPSEAKSNGPCRQSDGRHPRPDSCVGVFDNAYAFFHDVCYASFEPEEATIGFKGISSGFVFITFVCWGIVHLILTLGYDAIGIFICVMVIASVIFLMALFVIGLPLPGAMAGLQELAIGHALSCVNLHHQPTWVLAVERAIFSLSPAIGGYAAFARHCGGEGRNCVSDATAVVAVDTITSVIAALSIFSVVGYLAHFFGIPFCDMPLGEVGLTQLVWPAGTASIRGRLSNVVSAVVAILLCLPCISNALTLCEACVVSICESKVGSLCHFKRWPVILCVCIVYFIGPGLLLSTNLAFWLSRNFTYFSSTFAQTVGFVAESFGAGWLYLCEHAIEHVGAPAYWTHCATFFLGSVTVGVLALLEYHSLIAAAVGISVMLVGFCVALFALARPSDASLGEKLYYLTVFTLEPLRMLFNERFCQDSRIFRLPLLWSIAVRYFAPSLPLSAFLAGGLGSKRIAEEGCSWYIYAIVICVPLIMFLVGTLGFLLKPSLMEPLLPMQQKFHPVIAENLVSEAQYRRPLAATQRRRGKDFVPNVF